MNIEDEEMNLLPAGTKMELIRITRIRDVKKLTDIGVKGNPKIFKVDKTFLKHNVSHYCVVLKNTRGLSMGQNLNMKIHNSARSQLPDQK